MEPQVLEPGDVLRKHRRAKGWTIAALAQASGINKATISAIENGQRFRSDTLTRLMQALDVKTITMLPPVTLPDPNRRRLLQLYDAFDPEFQAMAVMALQQIQHAVEALQQSVEARAELARIRSALDHAKQQLAETQRRDAATRAKQATTAKRKMG